MSAFYMLSYLAFSLPAIAAGLAAGHLGLQMTTMGNGLALIVSATLAVIAKRPRS